MNPEQAGYTHLTQLTYISAPDLEQTKTLSPAFRNSFAKANPIPEPYR